MARPDRAEQLSACLGAVFDAVIAAESTPRFISALGEILDGYGFDLLLCGTDAEGAIYEMPAVTSRLGEVDFETEPKPANDGTDNGFLLGRGRGKDDSLGDLVLRCKAGNRGSAGKAMLEDIVGHVLRAMQLHRALVGGQVRGQATNIVLDSLPMGVILVNAEARILQVNRMAEEFLAMGDGLRADTAGLAASSPHDSERLREMVTQVATADVDAPATPVGVLRLERPSLETPWQIVALPVHARRRADTVSEVAALFVTETAIGGPSGIPPEALVRLFDLTPAEARLLVALVEGMALDETAKSFGVSKNTLRNQLNQVFRKTETNKQSELVRLVLSSPAPVLIRRQRDKEDG